MMNESLKELNKIAEATGLFEGLGMPTDKEGQEEAMKTVVDRLHKLPVDEQHKIGRLFLQSGMLHTKEIKNEMERVIRKDLKEKPFPFPRAALKKEKLTHFDITAMIDHYVDLFIDPTVEIYRKILREVVVGFMQTKLGYEGSTEMINTETIVFRRKDTENTSEKWMGDVQIRS